jgi:hypothetical protein
VFKLTQQHTNNWEVSKLLSLVIVLPLVDVQPLGYGQIYNIFSDHKCFDVTIGNYLGCSRIYFVVILATFLGGRGAWVQCRHLYHILQNIMYYGWTKKFIHYPMWIWDMFHHLLAHVKARETQWYYNKVRFVSIFVVPISFSLFIVQYVYTTRICHDSVSREIPRMK